MERKIVGMLVVTLLIATAVLPVVGTMNVGDNQGVGRFVQPINPPKPSNLPLLPPFLLELFNGDWNYWSNSPHMFAIPEGNVGIGTSNPTSELEVVGNVEADSFTINGNPIGTSSDSYWSEGEEGNIYYTSGNVGIGTSDPQGLLQVGENTFIVDSNGNVNIDGELSVTGGIDPTWIEFVPLTSPPSHNKEATIYYKQNDDEFYVYKDPGGWVPLVGGTGGGDDDWEWSSGSGLTGSIYRSGDVQIDDSDPSTGGPVSLSLKAKDGAVSGIYFGEYSESPTGIVRWSPDYNSLMLETGGSPTKHILLMPRNNVGIGVTIPTEKLHVVGNIRMVDGNEGSGKVLTSDTEGVASWQTASGGADNDWDCSGKIMYPSFDSNMIVLFGSQPWGSYTGTPRIQANAAGGARILGEQGNTPAKPAIGFFSTNGVDDGDGYGNGIYRPLAHTMAFATLSQERMRISAKGNVGIGTNNPQATLHVDDVLMLQPSTAPTSPLKGMIYYDATDNMLRCYDGAVWHNLW